MSSLTFDNVDVLCAGVDLTQHSPVIDLSEVSFIHPFALIYLGMFLRHFTHEGKGFRLQPPKNSAARDYLTRQNFWKRFNFEPKSLAPEMLRRITGRTSLNDIVDIERAHGVDEQVARKVRHVVASSSAKVDLELLEEIVAELVSNFARHSEGPLAALTMQWYPKLRQVRLAVGDCGVGIRKSLSTNRTYAYLKSRPHYEAAWQAFQPGVTRTKEAGFGLPTVLDDVQQVKGHVALATGNGYVRKQPFARPRWGNMAFELPGVQIEVVIPSK